MTKVASAPRADTVRRDKNFSRLWTAQSVSMLGSQVTAFVLPSLAILTLHASAFQVGLLLAANRICYPVLGLFAGVLVDRWSKQRTLILCNLLQAVVLTIIPAAYLIGRMGLVLLYGVAICSGTLALLIDVASRAFVPAIVSRDQLVDGNRRLLATDSAAQISGPAIAGYLVQLVRPALLIFIDVASFIFSAVVLSLIRLPEAPRQPDSPQQLDGFRTQFLSGLRYIGRDARLRSLYVYAMFANLGNTMIIAVFLVFAYREAKLTPELAGIVLGCGSVGLLVGTLMIRRFQRRSGVGLAMVRSSLLGGAALVMLVAGAATLTVPLMAISWLIFGIAVSMFNITMSSFIQAIVPAELRGRVTSVTMMVSWGMLPLGALIGGAVASAASPLTAILVGCLIRIAGTPFLVRRVILSIGSLEGDL